MGELTKRVLTAVIGIFLLLFVVNRGGVLLSTSILIISLIGILELYHALECIEIKPIYSIGLLSTIAIYLSTLTTLINLDLIITAIIILILIIYLFSSKYDLKDIGLTFLSIIYIPFLLFHIYYLDGTPYIWLVFIVAFGTDTFAYLVGSLFGKHRLYEKVSPKKSIEGAVGGIVGSTVLVVIYSINFNLEPIPLLVIMAIIASTVSQMGDLVASKIKRTAKIKDYGKIFLGHGGVMDRFDSIIFASPIIYYFIELLIV